MKPSKGKPWLLIITNKDYHRYQWNEYYRLDGKWFCFFAKRRISPVGREPAGRRLANVQLYVRSLFSFFLLKMSFCRDRWIQAHCPIASLIHRPIQVDNGRVSNLSLVSLLLQGRQTVQRTYWMSRYEWETEGLISTKGNLTRANVREQCGFELVS